MTYDVAKANYITKSADLIKQVREADKSSYFPQNILVYKMACSELEDEANDCTTLKIKDKFYFTEKLVNRLMLLAYLEGRNDIDHRSFLKGQADRQRSITESVRDLVADLGIDVYPDQE